MAPGVELHTLADMGALRDEEVERVLARVRRMTSRFFVAGFACVAAAYYASAVIRISGVDEGQVEGTLLHRDFGAAEFAELRFRSDPTPTWSSTSSPGSSQSSSLQIQRFLLQAGDFDL